MKRATLILFLTIYPAILFCQPGVYYHLCFRLYDTSYTEVDTSEITDSYNFRFVHFKHNKCEGIGFLTDESPQFHCLISSIDYCVFNSVLQIVKNQEDTMRVFFRYRSFNVVDRDYYVNNIVFLKGNYILKKPPDDSDWQGIIGRGSNIKKINGSIEKYRRRIFYCQLFALRRKSFFAKKIISDNSKTEN